MKVLVYKKISDLKPTGGPNGYCWNVYNGLKSNNIKFISFLTDEKEKEKYKANTIKKYLSTFFGKILASNKSTINFNDFDIIHFHSTLELYINRKSLRGYKGKIVLTSHSPVPLHMELTENMRNHHPILGTLLTKHAFKMIDIFAFNRADFILLPCKEAEESYFDNWKYYKKLHEKNKTKYNFIPSGIVPCQFKIDREQKREELGYSPNDFVVSYVGRHNTVKGYDRIINVREILKAKNISNIKFLIGGKEFPLKGPINDLCWKEIGWTNDPYSLINCSDVFLLPNRETYFDIILLEVLSLGQNCLISNTGGNKLILNDSITGIEGFETDEECAKKLIDIASKHQKDEHTYLIKEYFMENYSIDVFVKKYTNFLKEIYEGGAHEEN